MALSYEFSIGSVRAKETSLLNAQDIEQLLACQSIAQLCAVLSDKGLGSGDSVEEILRDRTEKTWAYLNVQWQLLPLILIVGDRTLE